MRSVLQRVARRLLGEYGLYRVWHQAAVHSCNAAVTPFDVRPLQPADLKQPGVAPELAEAAWYFGDQAQGFGCYRGESLLGVTFYWHGARYANRHSWPIPSDAAKLVHIVTAQTTRGQGVATVLYRESAAQMHAQGWRSLYARIWHSNTPSMIAIRRAGWQPCGWLLQINPLRRNRPWNLTLRSRMSVRT